MFLPPIFIPACNSSSMAFLMMCSVYRLSKQGYSRQPCRTPFSISNQSVVPYRVLTCFLTCIQVSQETGKMAWYSHLSKSFSQFFTVCLSVCVFVCQHTHTHTNTHIHQSPVFVLLPVYRHWHGSEVEVVPVRSWAWCSLFGVQLYQSPQTPRTTGLLWELGTSPCQIALSYLILYEKIS